MNGSRKIKLSPAWRSAVASRLLAWFGRAARELPWRQTRDLYAIWISEIMLQQTQVATVIPYWQRFLNRFPDVASLAVAEEREVMKLWEGLGYYRRARQLHAAARQIVIKHGGEFPTVYDNVCSLPGIGRYTAGAILSIGLDQRLPILEANSTRVLSRLAGYRNDVSSSAGQRQLWSLAESILPRAGCGAFNQSLMELGSEICTSRSPLCDHCPVASLCRARRQNLVAKIPARTKSVNYEDVTEIAVVVMDRGRVALRLCQAGERWAGLWDFPRFAPASSETARSKSEMAARTKALIGLDIVPGARFLTLKHGVTRFRITLHCYEATLRRPDRSTSGCLRRNTRLIPIESLTEYPLSTTGRKISRVLIDTNPKCAPATKSPELARVPRADASG